MSFSSSAKEEMLRLKPGLTDASSFCTDCCDRAELCALCATGGSITLGRRGMGFSFSTRMEGIARHTLLLMRRLYGLEPDLAMASGAGLQRMAYTLNLPGGQAEPMLQGLKLIQRTPDGLWSLPGGIDRSYFRRACCRKAYLRGAFLGAGSVSDPAGGYHLEIAAQNQQFADDLMRLMLRLKLPARITAKKSGFTVYLKEGEAIENALVMMGAHTAMLNLGNARILKDVRNNVNRAVNCESANIEKTMDAARRQRTAIEQLKADGAWGSLPPELRELGDLRLRYPEATLVELGQMLERPVGKSGVNHRLRRIEAAAQQTAREGKGN